MDIRLKRLFLSQLYELSFYSKKCATHCSLIREPLGGPLSLGIRFSESLSMTTDLGLFGAIFDRMSISKSLKIKVLFQILRKSVESQFNALHYPNRLCILSHNKIVESWIDRPTSQNHLTLLPHTLLHGLQIGHDERIGLLSR